MIGLEMVLKDRKQYMYCIMVLKCMYCRGTLIVEVENGLKRRKIIFVSYSGL